MARKDSDSSVLDADIADAASAATLPETEKPKAKIVRTPRKGDVVMFRDPEQHAGVVDPEVKPAIVVGIHPDGDLTLSIFGRIPGRLSIKTPYAAKGEQRNFTWHHRDEQ